MALSLVRLLQKREWQILLALVFIVLLLHLWIVPFQQGLVFDEQYYVPDARAILGGDQLEHTEHPALGKLIIASGIAVLGDNPWGWRVPSVLFAVASIVIFYFICRRLTGELAALLATVLFAFESLYFNHSGLAILDGFSLTFMLLGFLLYLHNRHLLAGTSLALSALCKLTGLFGFAVILVHWLITRRVDRPGNARALLGFALVTPVALIVLLTLFDFAATRVWHNPAEMLVCMSESYQALTFESGLAELGGLPVSSPIQWILAPTFYSATNHQIFVGMSPTVWAMIIPSVGYVSYSLLKKRSSAPAFILLWFAATYLAWILVVADTGRATYLYYFLPTVGAVCMAMGLAMQRLWQIPRNTSLGRYRDLIRVVIVGYLCLHVLWILGFSPIVYAAEYYGFEIL